jgi:capsular polysaccharide biosynthesis protein
LFEIYGMDFSQKIAEMMGKESVRVFSEQKECRTKKSNPLCCLNVVDLSEIK